MAGIKEALRVGTERSVLSTSSVDGSCQRTDRIALPNQLDPVAATCATTVSAVTSTNWKWA